MKHRFKFLTLLLVLLTIPAGIFARESKFTKQRTIVLEYVPIQFPVWNIDA